MNEDKAIIRDLLKKNKHQVVFMSYSQRNPMAALTEISGNILIHFAFLIVLLFNMNGLKYKVKKGEESDNCP